jgi:nucleoid-associated protein YgaU
MALNPAKLAAEMVGAGSLNGGLEKLVIRYEKTRKNLFNGSIEALFNPNEFTISRNVKWKSKGVAAVGSKTTLAKQEFRSTAARTLAITLFFDTYEARGGGLSLGKMAKDLLIPTNPFTASPEATNVKEYTDQIAALAQVNTELHRPPICKLRWGEVDLFKGVLTSLSEKYTMFMPDGRPVRATLECSFVEYFTHAAKAGELHSADVPKTHVVRRHETLQSIAAAHYDDPTLWRHIAQANGILNPRLLTPGMTLLIPALRPT